MSNESPPAIYRILDSSANRAGEGLRTMEEYARFVLDHTDLTDKLKSLRHELALTLGKLDRTALLRARDTAGDVGTDIQASGEYSRPDGFSVVQAASNRTQQSLRVLEEYSKIIDPTVGAAIEQIRYRTYATGAELELSIVDKGHQDATCSDLVRSKLLAEAQLYVLIDSGESEEDFVIKVKTLSAAGVDVLQLRDRDQCDRVLFQRAVIGSQLARQQQTLFIVNDRADIAAAAGADGVHVGQDEVPPRAVRQIIGRNRILGVSTHDLEQVHTAITDGADYIGCGPVFPSQTKSFDRFVGTSFLSDVHNAEKARPLPAFAIGGITNDNVDQVISSGFHRVAVTGAISKASNPVAATKQLLQKLQPTC
jgi:thiamine-phosphate pyrophosphorylase